VLGTIYSLDLATSLQVASNDLLTSSHFLPRPRVTVVQLSLVQVPSKLLN